MTAPVAAPPGGPVLPPRREIPRQEDDYTAAARGAGWRSSPRPPVSPRSTSAVTPSTALVHTELLADGSYYYSITIPALIVATYGGGTGLPTQRECLELLGCYGPGRVRKFAEIVAATVLCGEVSLGAAVVAGEWVTAHERFGRNRP